jgi:hypothetical protein
MLNFKEILHLLADGISLAGPVRQDVHDAINALEDLFKTGTEDQPKPVALDATVTGGAGTAKLTWTAPVSPSAPVARYEVTRAGEVVANLGAAWLAWTDQGIDAGSYAYTVDAVDAAGTTVAASDAFTVTVTAYQAPPAG